MKKSTFALLLGCALVVTPWVQVACAAGSEGTGFYAGGGAGVSRAKIDSAAISSSLLSIGATTATTTTDESSAAYKVFVGYSFNRYFAIEGGYFDLGKFKFDSTISPSGTLHAEAKPRGVNIDAVLSYPLAKGFSLFARGGVQSTQTKATLSGSGSLAFPTLESTETKAGWKVGLGLGYEFTGGLEFTGGVGLRAEWERYRVPDGSKSNEKADVDVFGVNLYYRF